MLLWLRQRYTSEIGFGVLQMSNLICNVLKVRFKHLTLSKGTLDNTLTRREVLYHDNSLTTDLNIEAFLTYITSPAHKATCIVKMASHDTYTLFISDAKYNLDLFLSYQENNHERKQQ